MFGLIFKFFKKIKPKAKKTFVLDEALPPMQGEVPMLEAQDLLNIIEEKDTNILKSKPWIGVDLDGTLAKDVGWRGFDFIGEPVPIMLERVRHWISQGYIVKIVTARASVPEKGIEPVKKWLKELGLPELDVVCCKDFDMIELWDDRAIQVVKNTGRPFLSASLIGRPAAPILPSESSDETFYLLKKESKIVVKGVDKNTILASD